jgi:hypothetical protein
MCKARFRTITRLSRRKHYRAQGRKARKVTQVDENSQNSSMNWIRLVQEQVERILSSELHMLFDEYGGVFLYK